MALHLTMNDPETLQYLDWAKDTYTLEDARSSIFDYFWAQPGRWAIVEKGDDNNVTIGSIDIRINKAKELAEFGYVLNKAYWGKGYMTQALQAVIALAFDVLDVNKVESQHYDGNEKSGRVMQKCGMVLEGIKKQHKPHKGRYVDEVMYGITKEAYLNRTNKE